MTFWEKKFKKTLVFDLIVYKFAFIFKWRLKLFAYQMVVKQIFLLCIISKLLFYNLLYIAMDLGSHTNFPAKNGCCE